MNHINTLLLLLTLFSFTLSTLQTNIEVDGRQYTILPRPGLDSHHEHHVSIREKYPRIIVQKPAPIFEAKSVLPNRTFTTISLTDYRGKQVISCGS